MHGVHGALAFPVLSFVERGNDLAPSFQFGLEMLAQGVRAGSGLRDWSRAEFGELPGQAFVGNGILERIGQGLDDGWRGVARCINGMPDSQIKVV